MLEFPTGIHLTLASSFSLFFLVQFLELCLLDLKAQHLIEPLIWVRPTACLDLFGNLVWIRDVLGELGINWIHLRFSLY